MAKPELRDHRKFLKLQRLMGEPRPHLMGYLECLWLRGYQTGRPDIGDSLDVESAAEFPGEIGKLTAALLEAGFIDKNPDGIFTIHDLYEHAPKYARLRMSRKGTAPIVTAPPVHASPKPTENGTHVPRKRKKRLARTPKTKTYNREPKAEIREPKTENKFPAFWEAYPRKVDKPAAERAFKKAAVDAATNDAILAGVERWKKSEQWSRADGKFIKYPAAFLNARMWEDDPEPAKTGVIDHDHVERKAKAAKVVAELPPVPSREEYERAKAAALKGKA